MVTLLAASRRRQSERQREIRLARPRRSGQERRGAAGKAAAQQIIEAS